MMHSLLFLCNYFLFFPPVSCCSRLLPVRLNNAHPCFLCVPAGNTLCKSGSIAVFGNVVYSGLLNDHLWHLGVPLFTRLVRAAHLPPCCLRGFMLRHSAEPKQASGAESPKVSNRRLLTAALMTCVGYTQDVILRQPHHILASHFIADLSGFRWETEAKMSLRPSMGFISPS